MMAELKEFAFILLCVFVCCHSKAAFGPQSKIEFYNLPQAQKLWDDAELLGDSTIFYHPVTLGTFTECDDLELIKVFDNTSDYKFFYNYTLKGNTSKEQRSSAGELHYTNIAVRVVLDAAYRSTDESRAIRKEILSAEGCVTACVTEKDFVCRDCDYFDGDNGKCALYDSTGVVFTEDPTTNSPYYVGHNDASTHYFVYRKGEVPETCNIPPGGYAHPYFALGWKAMETGWYNLAHNMLDRAISIDAQFYLAYVGKMLGSENMGYGVREHKESLQTILEAKDFKIRLSFQEQVLAQALSALYEGEDFEAGLTEMLKVFNNFEGFKDQIIRVVEGNAQLLRRNLYDILNELVKDKEKRNIYAVHLLTHNLNPYKNGKDLISQVSQKAATDAVFHYQESGVVGAWQITADCADISEYYAKWQGGKQLLDRQKTFLFKNTDPADPTVLFGESEVDVVVHNVDVVYMTRALRRVSSYERLHFFELQLGQFQQAKATLDGINLKGGMEELLMQKHRMAANAYFTTYDYIYNTYAEKLEFEEDWRIAINFTTNDLALAGRTYYWAAAAVQKLRKSQSVDEIKTALDAAKEAASYESYKTLIDIHRNVVIATEKLRQLDYNGALESAKLAGKLQAQLANATFTIEGNDDSKEFRMLIPLGYQFEADMLNALLVDEAAKAALGSSVTAQSVIDAYERAVNTPPLKASRILRGYGVSLERRDKNKPRLIDQSTPDYVLAFEFLDDAWKNHEVEGTFAARVESAQAVEHYYNLPISGCGKAFQISSDGDGQLCWGGYVIIGVAVALVVIICIIIGILCLRRKAKAPRRNKEKEGAFIFSGPNLSRQDSFGSSSRIGLGTMTKGSTEATPYASQTLSIQRPFQDSDYTQRSNTIGGMGQTGEFEAYSSH